MAGDSSAGNIEGPGYQLAAKLVIYEVLACGQLNLEVFKTPPFTGFPPTDDEMIEVLLQQEEKRLKELFDPLEVWARVTMPIVKSELEKIERIMVERGFRLSKWDKPKSQRNGSRAELINISNGLFLLCSGYT